MQAIEQEIRQFIIGNFLFGASETTLSNDDSLLDLGIIDSTGVLELVAFLEDQYEIKIRDDELVPKNLDSVNNLVQFIDRKIPSRSTTGASYRLS
jgi:acyl carrier protein